MYESRVSDSYENKDEALKEIRRMMRSWGHVDKSHKYSIQVGLDLMKLMGFVHKLGGCDDIKSMADDAWRAGSVYFYSHLSSFHRNYCLNEGR